MKHKFSIWFFWLCILTAHGQSGYVIGSVNDSKSNEGLIGTNILLSGGDFQKALSSASNGKFTIENVPYGEYKLTITYIGYQDHETVVLIDKEFVSLGRIFIYEGVALDEVQIIEEKVAVQQKGDTTEYNATSYKTLPDADATDLITKIPTVNMENGTVEAQGEEVQQVLVDGKPFFGNDPNAALKNIPAEIIEKVQIFDQASDQAQFTGFDDGETTKTINIITRVDKRKGKFGKIYVGYGTDNRYQSGGNINIFNGDQRISLIGLSNNVNIQNFSSEDLLGVIATNTTGRGRRRGGRGGGGGPGGGRRYQSSGASASDFTIPQQGGISSAHAFGINFSDHLFKKLEVNASYFFNLSDNTTEQDLSQQYFDSEGLSDLYTEESLAGSTNVNHRLSALVNYEINESNSLRLRSNAIFQGNNGVQYELGQTMLESALLNQAENVLTSDLSAINSSNALLWRHKFNKVGRTITLNLNGGIAPQRGEKFLNSDNLFGTQSIVLNQNSLLDQNQWNAGANLQYTEPINKKSRIVLEYRTSYQQDNDTQETFDFDEDDMEYTNLNEGLSNIFNNDYISQSGGAGYSLKVGDWRWSTRGQVQWSRLLTEQRFPYEAETNNSFLNFLPMSSLSYRPSRSNHFRIAYRTNTDLPSITQLQTVIDNSNPLQLTSGNSGLVQAVQHNIVSIYSKTYTERSSVLFFLLSGGLTNNYISSNTYLTASDFDPSLEDDAQITIPVNVDGYYNMRALTTYGFPIAKIKTNLNIDLSANLTNTPGLVNGELNYARNNNVGLGLTFSSNISDRIDFTIASRSSNNYVANSLQSESNTSYFNQRTRVKLDWIIAKGIIFRTEMTNQAYVGLDDSFDQNFTMWNMSLGKKLFKDDRGEISVSVFDLLNQNNALSRNVNEAYIEDIQTNVLQQYFMLHFKYDLRHFKISDS